MWSTIKIFVSAISQSVLCGRQVKCSPGCFSESPLPHPYFSLFGEKIWRNPDRYFYCDLTHHQKKKPQNASKKP